MSSSVQSEVSSQGPFSPKKKYHQTEGKGSLEESIHNVKHLDLTMARSNHSVDFSTLDDNNSDGSSADEIVEVDETETGWDEDNDIEHNTECKKGNDVVVVATNNHNNNDNNNDDSSYEEEIIEEEIYDIDDDDEMVDATAATPTTVTVRDEIPVQVPQIQRMTLEEEIAQHESATNIIISASATTTISPQPPISSYHQQQQQSSTIKVDDSNNNDVESKNLSWEKPEWTKSPVLKNTAKGQFMKAGGTVSAPITNIAAHVVAVAETEKDKKDLSFQKPDWTTNTKLRSTGKADVLKSEGNLAKPITNLPHLYKDFDKDELTMLEKNNIITTVATPTPSSPSRKVKDVDENDDDDDTKKIGWEKPEWATKKVLKGTQKGDKLKAGGTLSRPIGGIKPIDD